MKEDLEATKKLIEIQVKSGYVHMFGIPFSEYQKVYKDTNENIGGYMSILNIQDKSSALSVLASGDHIFNLAYYGIKDMMTFDTNKLTQYYALGLKRAAILAFPYHKYLEFMRTITRSDISLEQLNALIGLLFPFMDETMKIYWQELIDYNYHLQKNINNPLNLFQMLLINIADEEITIKKNLYLKSEIDYEKARLNLAKANIYFRWCDCLYLDKKIPGQYDLLFLSNIPDYFYKTYGHNWKYSKLLKYEKRLEQVMNDGGLAALAYLIQYGVIDKDFYKTYPILSSSITKKDLKDEEIITFPHIHKEAVSHEAVDGLLLKRYIK